jgi:uncharacterized alpha-E superfamily protein
MPPRGDEAAASRLLGVMKRCRDLAEDIEAAALKGDAAYAASLVRTLERAVTNARAVAETWTVEQQKEM